MKSFEQMRETCECWQCDGEGKYEAEINCDCEGCFQGEHTVDLPCGQEATAPCERCNWDGVIKKVIPCEDCNCSGLIHEFVQSNQVQETLIGTTCKIRTCRKCEYSEIKAINLAEVKKNGT